MHFQPNLEHFEVFKSCLRHSATEAADPAITPTSDKIEGFSGEITVRSNAAGFPRNQLRIRTSAGLVWHLLCPKPLTTSTWANTLARLQHSTNKFIVVGNYIAPMLASNGMVEQRIQGKTWTEGVFETLATILRLLEIPGVRVHVKTWREELKARQQIWGKKLTANRLCQVRMNGQKEA